MILRDLLAATLIVAGIASTSVGASLLSPAAGFLTLGALLLGFGVGLGVGDWGTAEPAPAAEPADEELPVAVAAQGSDADEDAIHPFPQADNRPVNPRHPSTGPTLVPIANYLGVRSADDEPS